MKLLDSNIFLRYFDGSATESGRAAYALFHSIEDGHDEGLVVDCVLHEVCYVLSSSNQRYNLDHTAIRNRLISVLLLPGIHVIPDKGFCLEALDVFTQGETIDFTDALQIVHVRRGLVEGIYSFDRKMDKI